MSTRPPDDWLALIVAWLDWLRAGQTAKGTMRLRGYQLRRFAAEHAEHSPMFITLDHLADWLARDEWSPETRKSQRAALRGFFSWMQITERRADDPSRLLRRVRVPSTPWRGIDEASVSRITRSSNERIALLSRMASTLGMRAAELAVSHSADVFTDFVGWSITVHGKGGKVRVVPLPDELALELIGRGAGYFFPGRAGDGHLSPGHITRLLSQALGSAGTGHGLRHRAAGHFYTGTDYDVRAVQELLGHASMRTTQIYLPARTDQMRRGVMAAARAGAGL